MPYEQIHNLYSPREPGPLKIGDGGKGIPAIPMSPGSRYPTKADLLQENKRKNAIRNASNKKNEERGIPPEVQAELKRLNEQTKSFAYKDDYYTASKIGLFIADRFLSNAVAIEASESSTDSPVYGYRSRHFDAVMRGNVIVQGVLTIAYTDPGYLGSFLQRYDVSSGAADGKSVDVRDGILEAKRLWWGLSETQDQIESIPMNFRHSRGTDGVVGRGFDLTIVYADQDFFENPERPLPEDAKIEVIKDIHITGRSQSAQPSGGAINEMWTFFASSIQTERSPRNVQIRNIRMHPTTQELYAPAIEGPIVGPGQNIRIDQ